MLHSRRWFNTAVAVAACSFSRPAPALQHACATQAVRFVGGFQVDSSTAILSGEFTVVIEPEVETIIVKIGEQGFVSSKTVWPHTNSASPKHRARLCLGK